MKKLINGVLAAAMLVSVAACASSQAQQTDLTPPARPLDAKTQLECGTKRGCR
jgi:Flp pilus assembly protein TadD